MGAIYWKELEDHFASWRYLVLVILVCFVSIFAVWVASQTIIDNVRSYPTESVFLRIFVTGKGSLPPFFEFVMRWFGPLIGILLGFDAINSERSRGTLSRILSQPVYRDAVINGKFLAGLTVIAVMMGAIIVLVSALGLIQTGITPSSAEVARLVCFYLISVVYIGFWLALGMLFSVLFRSTIFSALVPLALWLFFAVFMVMIAGAVADWKEPINSDSQASDLVHNINLERQVKRISPLGLSWEASRFVLDPEQRTSDLAEPGEMVESQAFGTPPTVSLRQSITLVWPHIVVLVGLIGICFAASYIRFVKEEIRAT
ncbi:MAG: ABC transporter permease [Chloroflexi bacterium]|nr:ABC transporter permease [Chloroflexota bacterium]